jgi:hypothetical protein
MSQGMAPMWHVGVADTVRRMIGRVLSATLTAVFVRGVGSPSRRSPPRRRRPASAIKGTTITVSASAAAVKAMRAALKRNGYVTAGVTITATAKDGVVDTAGITWRYR